MRSALAAAAQRRAGRARSTSLSTIPPPEDSDEYDPALAAVAASVLYRSPLLSHAGRPVYILNAAAFPDAFEVDYDSLLSYVLARLPDEDELISGTEYEIIFFAGGQPENATAEKKQGPSTGWYLQAYHVLGRATRKKLQMLYIVHPRTWVRVLISIFGTIVSPKFRRKILHVNSLSSLALYIPIERLLIPPSAYTHDRKVLPDIYVPYVTGQRAFGARHPLPKNISTGETRLPRVLRETTTFILMPQNIKIEGLFRIPPSSILAGVLREAYDRSQQFIVWKEATAVLAPPGLDKSVVDELRIEDTYGVHLAASLIKTWYRELREPIVPESIYARLEDDYGNPQKHITPEDLVDLILPASQKSPLTPTAREILIRHLLPMLSMVASHETENRMNAENLAILFSMCLVRGTNQLEDGKVSTTVRKILTEAIKAWPELRAGLAISSSSFEADLRAPADLRLYEDPLEDDMPRRSPEDEEVENRITMTESADSHASAADAAPALPPRRSRAASIKAALSSHHVIDALPSLPKRRPTTAVPDPATSAGQPNVENPPRYSTVFDADGNSIHLAESPITMTPANGFGPPKRSGFSFDENDQLGNVPSLEPTIPHSITEMPKRKAVSSLNKEGPDGVEPGNTVPTEQAFEPSGLLAQMAAHQIANGVAQRPTADANAVSGVRPSMTFPGSVQTKPTWSNGESIPNQIIHRKPSGTTLANGGARQPSDIHSLARQVVPAAYRAQTIPVIKSNDSNALSTPVVPKPRTPSPGLLKRMTSMENTRANQDASAQLSRATLEPKKLNLRKTSVDDLRRLYEERVNTANDLAVAATATANTTNA